MKPFILIAVSIVALGVAGCKKEPTPQADPAEATVAASGDAIETPAPAGPAEVFVNSAASSDAFEIETSKLATTKSQSAEIKTFAESMIKAHTDSTAKLKTAAAAATPAVTPNPALDAGKQQILTQLQSKSGAEFDAAYVTAQANAHEATLDTLKAYAANGQVASLKAFAVSAVPIVTAHLGMAKKLK